MGRGRYFRWKSDFSTIKEARDAFEKFVMLT